MLCTMRIRSTNLINDICECIKMERVGLGWVHKYISGGNWVGASTPFTRNTLLWSDVRIYRTYGFYYGKGGPGISEIGGTCVAQSASCAAGGSGKASNQSIGVLKPSRATPYNKASGGGAIRRQRTRDHRREMPQIRYSHLLSDLRVADFIHETPSSAAMDPPLAMRGPSSSSAKEYRHPIVGYDGWSEIPKDHTLGSQIWRGAPPDSDCRLEYYPPEITKEGKCQILITQEDLKLSAQSKKQKPVRVKLASQQHGPSRSRGNNVPKGLGERQKGGAPSAKQQGTYVEYVQAEAVEEWSQGEWDFFADKCLEMELDPENSILYPEEDTEIENVEDIDGFDSVHAVSHLKKSGSNNDGDRFIGVGSFNEEAEVFVQFDGHPPFDWGVVRMPSAPFVLFGSSGIRPILENYTNGVRDLFIPKIAFGWWSMNFGMAAAHFEGHIFGWCLYIYGNWLWDPTIGSEPPDLGTEGKFWSSDNSDEDAIIEGDSMDRQKGSEYARRRGKSKAKPSRHLDGCFDSAMRRYGLRSTDGDLKSNQGTVVSKNGKLKAIERKTKKESRRPMLDKENIPDEINQPNNHEKDTTGISHAMQEDEYAGDVAMHGNMVDMQDTQNGILLALNPNTDLEPTHNDALGEVMMNTEYAGDSILDSLSRYDSNCNVIDCNSGDDQEVSSDQLEKSNSCLEGAGESSNKNISFVLSDEGMGLDNANHLNGWEKLGVNQWNVKWPDVWCYNDNLDLDNASWKDRMMEIRKELETEKKEGKTALNERPPWAYFDRENHNDICFFIDLDAMVECLAKWKRTLIQGNNEAWRKVKPSKGKRVIGLDSERNACPPEEDTHGTRKKRYKSGLDMENVIQNGRNGICEDNKKETVQGNFQRTRHKICTVAKKKEARDKRKRLGEFYKHIATREEKLKDIVRNINTTDENRNLINSILSMTSYKLAKSLLNKMIRGRSTYRAMGLGMNLGGERNIVNLNTRTKDKEGGASEKQNTIELKNKPSERSHVDEATEEPRITTNRTGLERTKKPKSPKVTLLETSNSFSLLDEEGNVLEEIKGGQDVVMQEIEKLNNLNDGWIKKQERTLNAKYNQEVSQDQRFEAKRYVLDKLVPLESVFSSWSRSQIEFFRHLCSLYNFGEGYLMASRNRNHRNDQEDAANIESEDSMEEVCSETDATAVFMKNDEPHMDTTMYSVGASMPVD
ncbi:hypothetical protein L1987_84570 [Smallanthus sonchifolius]|uniref:Uncharacterized protein n=1 Tax=Smallanthus sonchifolius TaxID=185202 RepID=A0ACB8YEF0_9ASTR|nr:hypothetical protein L1987_84570 [Smallanthus sonchifolius]